jgi:cystathionine beta-synthase
MAERLAQEMPGSLYVNQFANPANPLAHETGTGPEIWQQMNHAVDAVVVGVGSGGTLTGLGRFLKRVAPKTKMILADPKGSVLAHMVTDGKMVEAGSWLVEGIGEDFVPPNCDLSLVSEAFSVSDAESFATARELLHKEAILAGSSTGTLLAAALKYCRAQSEPRRVVTIACDSGNKYLSKMFNDYWMLDQGLLARERQGDLRDLIARRHVDQATITVSPTDSLLIAYQRMKLYEISQLPVLDRGKVVGIIDESDLLLAVYGHADKYLEPIAGAMTTRLEFIQVSQPIGDLAAVLSRHQATLVMEGGEFLGLVTRIDLLNHLRRSIA